MYPQQLLVAPWHVICLIHSIYFFCIQFHRMEVSSTSQNSKALQLLCRHLSYTSMSTCTSLTRYLVCTSCVFFLSTACWRLTLTCGHNCNIARALAHVTNQLPRHVCLFLDRIPSIEGGTINNADVPGDVNQVYFVLSVILDLYRLG